MTRSLELFRLVVAFIVGHELPRSKSPTRIYAFRSARDFEQFKPKQDFVAYFRATLRGSEIVTSGSNTSHLQHEYTHYLTQYHRSLIYPMWYSEGFAEFLGATALGGATVEIGKIPRRGPPPLPRSSGYNPWIPIEVLLAHGSDGSEQPEFFYNAAWLLVHYLYIGREFDGNSRRQVGKYIQLVQRGVPIAAAVERSFGVSAQDLDAELVRYAKRNRYTNYSRPAANFGELPVPEVRTLAPARVAVALGDLSMSLDRVANAATYYADALARAPQSIRGLCGLARVLEARGETEHADSVWSSALAASQNDPITHLDFANSRLFRAYGTESAAAREALLVLAREHYVTSQVLDASVAESFANYGATYLFDGEPIEKAREPLEHALEMEPSSLVVLARLAEYHLRAGDTAEARRLALRVRGSAHGGHFIAANSILEQTGGIPGSEAGD